MKNQPVVYEGVFAIVKTYDDVSLQIVATVFFFYASKNLNVTVPICNHIFNCSYLIFFVEKIS